VAEVSLGVGSALSLGDGDSLGWPEPDGAGAVGVGTGGGLQAHSAFVGFILRIGLISRRAMVGETGGGMGGSVGAIVGSGATSLPGFSGFFVFVGPRPIPEVDASVDCDGTVPASAWEVFRIEPRPFTTPRYAPAAPTTVSTPSAVTSAARRGPRALGGTASSVVRPPNVFIPVEVMSGPFAGGATGRRPMSYRTDRSAPDHSARTLRHRLIALVLRSGTL
jgi:hypothetical protein